MVASIVFPFLILNIHKPMMMAIGIVAAIVNVPHELSDKELITTSPNPAKAITIIISTAMLVVMPLIFPISALAILTIDLPSWLTEATKITKSYTAPAITAPTSIHINPVHHIICLRELFFHHL